MMITNRSANTKLQKGLQQGGNKAATRLQRAALRAATKGCNKGLPQGLQQGCNGDATRRQRSCNRAATNPANPCQHFLNTFFEALSTSSAQKTWQNSTSKIDQTRRRQTSILDMLLTTSRSTYASKTMPKSRQIVDLCILFFTTSRSTEDPNHDVQTRQSSILVSCFSRRLGRQRFPDLMSITYERIYMCYIREDVGWRCCRKEDAT